MAAILVNSPASLYHIDMDLWPKYVVLALGAIALIFLITGIIKCRRGQAFAKFLPLNLIGAFVWGDAVPLGFFWTLAAAAILLWSSWRILLLTLILFWLVRSVGETIYWLNQQFSKEVRVPPHTLWFHPFFKNNSVWFVYQVFWQCVTVITLLLLYWWWQLYG